MQGNYEKGLEKLKTLSKNYKDYRKINLKL